jgi:3-oxoacyl-[acyl-carrier-protein] synthase II
MESQSSALSPTKRALQAIQILQAKVDALEKAKHQPIAVIGLGCRFPGANSPAEFWDLLQSGRDAITEVPSDRWDAHQYYSSDPNSPGKMITCHGGFISNLFGFDAKFFHISPREALSLDPQQRLLLEVSWEALENAGLAPSSLENEQVGVFVGISAIDYWHQLLARSPDHIDAYLTTGNTHSVASGRISHLLGLTGPSLSIDAACSSSLSAVHLACQSLRNGECNIALAGGVNGILMPEISINFSQAQMLSPDGRCKSFDAAADGFGRAEGCGVIVLKRLGDIAEGDNIRAVILGSALNHTGHTSGLTVPNGPAQQRVIGDAIAAAQITPHHISYIEAHGTGTALGDPIELGALGEVFGPHRAAPLLVGSVKTNIGHLEAASGMAGLIKVILSLQHRAIPANLHFQTPTPYISWANQPLQVPTQLTPWPASDQPRIAGVSAFGFNGTNAHLIVSEAPDAAASHPSNLPHHLLTLSAQTAPALQQLIGRYIHFLHQSHLPSLGALCWTANTGRSQFSHRLAVIAASISELRSHLVTISQGTIPASAVQGQGNSSSTLSVQLTHEYIQISGLAAQVLPRPPTPEQWLSVLQALAEQYVAGASIHWQLSGPHRKVELPTYPFQRQHYGL